MKRTLLALLLSVAACGAAPQKQRGLFTEPRTSPAAYEHYIRARMAAERGDHELSVVELRMAAAAAEDDTELRVSIGDELLSAGNLATARAEAEELAALQPKSASAWRLLGRTRAAQADAAGAAQALERAAKLDPDDEDVWLLLAAVRRQLGDERRAIEAYRNLLSRLPSSAEGHFRLGRSLAATGVIDAARAELARAIEIDPDHIDARVALAEVYRRTGHPGDAEAALRAAFDRSGSDASVGERLFQVLLETGDQVAAADLLRKIDAGWRSSTVRLRLGLLFLQLHLTDDALRIARAMLARDPGDHASRILAARAHAQAGRRAEAITTCREVPADSYAYIEARSYAAELLGRDGTPNEGLALLEPALTAYPDEAQLLAAAAALHEQLGAVGKARTILDTAIERAPADETLIYARATLEDRAREPDKGVAIMKRLLERDADNVLALNYIGFSYADRGIDGEAAQHMLEHALDLRPDDAFIIDSLGWLHLRRGQLDRARPLLERALRLQPFEPEILYHMGELQLRRGEDARARDTFRTALALDPTGRIREQLEERVRTLEAKAP